MMGSGLPVTRQDRRMEVPSATTFRFGGGSIMVGASAVEISSHAQIGNFPSKITFNLAYLPWLTSAIRDSYLQSCTNTQACIPPLLLLLLLISHSKVQFEILYNLLTALWTISNAYAQVAQAQACANHVQLSSTYYLKHVMLRATWYEGTAQLLSLTDYKLHLLADYTKPKSKQLHTHFVIKPFITLLKANTCACMQAHGLHNSTRQFSMERWIHTCINTYMYVYTETHYWKLPRLWIS